MAMPEEIDLTHLNFIDQTTIAYGASGSGKSVFITDVMHMLKPYVPQVIIVSPTDPSNKTYSNGMVSPPLIHYELTEDLLITIWKRQEAFAAVYTKVNTFEVLESLFMRLQHERANSILERMNVVKAEKIMKLHDMFKGDEPKIAGKTKDIEDQLHDMKLLVFKKFIVTNTAQLAKLELTNDERFALEHITFNPRMLIVLDDCSADFRKIKSIEGKSVLNKMFFQNRWSFMTVIIALHDDKLMDSELRKNVFVNAFTTSQAAITFYSRVSNAGTTAIARQVAKWASEGLWKANGKNQKLVFLRSEGSFFRFTASQHMPFTFGAGCVSKYCEAVKSTGINIDPNNPFMNYFR